MKKNYSFSLLFFLLISYGCFSQEKLKYTPYEKTCMGLFNDFLNYIKDHIQDNSGINDSSQAIYIWSSYLFTESKIDSPAKLNSLERELGDFYQFFQERENKKLLENVTMMPIRISPDKSIYDKLTTFQKNNTFIFYDKRSPSKTLGYMLFIPPVQNKIPVPRIWSWTLIFKFGKFAFKSATGEEGYEYIFSPEEFKK